MLRACIRLRIFLDVVKVLKPYMACENAGTVVKRKRGGKFLADLAKHGDEIMVARGGRGGVCFIFSLPELSAERLIVAIPCKPMLKSSCPILRDMFSKSILGGYMSTETPIFQLQRLRSYDVIEKVTSF